LDAQDTIRRLEQQLRELQEAKMALDARERELNEMTRRLASEREMEVSEREKLAEEIQRRELEVERIRRHVEEKDEETRRLQMEVEDARRRQQEAQEALVSATTEAMRHNRMNNVLEVERPVSHEPIMTMVESDEHEDHERMSNGDIRENKVELTTDETADVRQWELERETHVERNIDMRARLEELKAELEEERIEDRRTEEDVRYEFLAQGGQTKYKTLTQIRAGTTRRRIDQFENL